jgi:hypothetical protein
MNFHYCAGLTVGEGGGVPDGMTIDSDGKLLSLCHCVLCWLRMHVSFVQNSTFSNHRVSSS